ncbi:MAG: D-alanine--D-alanine ligase [Patescibacteria group bacterium]
MPRKKTKIGVIFGGKSAEHEISLQSARNIIDALDKKKYDVVLIGIDKSGQWLFDADATRLLDPSRSASAKKLIAPHSRPSMAVRGSTALENADVRGAAGNANVIFPVLHGPYGEDGSMQGLLRIAGLPFVGAGILGSAVGMDKDVMKRLLRDAEIPTAKFVTIRDRDKISFRHIIRTLGLPVFVKPANLGSSIGVEKTKNRGELATAVKRAFQYDSKILIEEEIAGREIECSVLGNEDPAASLPGEVIPTHEFYSYDAKYTDPDGARVDIPAKIPARTVRTVQKMAIETFKALNCEGMARVDFFLKPNGELLVNEINTIPGFTAISMYPKLWEASGLSYSALLDRLIDLAVERFNREKKLKSSR